ncbi:MAG: T9SS type A sorting domain-containing protein, partial [Bacteroidota bacterium]
LRCIKNADVPSTTTVNGNVTGTACYNATQTITVAGSGTTFAIQNGGSATLIAGHNIIYKPTSKVYSGGYMHGYITTNGQFCGTRAPSAPAVIAGEEGQPITIEKSSFKVYPNPTTGNFILELTGEIPSEKMQAEIYGIWGEKVLTATLNGKRMHEISLSDKPTGVYFIRVVTGDKAETLKIIKQ